MKRVPMKAFASFLLHAAHLLRNEPLITAAFGGSNARHTVRLGETKGKVISDSFLKTDCHHCAGGK